MERIAMSQEERDDLGWLKRARDGSISQREAAKKMGVSDRWVRTLLKRMNQQGDAVVVHGLRGRPSNRKLPAKIQRQAPESQLWPRQRNLWVIDTRQEGGMVAMPWRGSHFLVSSTQPQTI